jgi:hypothetical protein
MAGLAYKIELNLYQGSTKGSLSKFWTYRVKGDVTVRGKCALPKHKGCS